MSSKPQLERRAFHVGEIEEVVVGSDVNGPITERHPIHYGASITVYTDEHELEETETVWNSASVHVGHEVEVDVRESFAGRDTRVSVRFDVGVGSGLLLFLTPDQAVTLATTMTKINQELSRNT